MILAVARLEPGAVLPTRAYDGDGGLDLYAAHGARIEPGERAAVGTGIAVAIPAGHAGLVLPRSGLAARHGIALVNAPGLIDAGYRGEAFTVAPGDRIAQLLVVAFAAVAVTAVETLESTERAARGFGSSG